MTPQDFRRIALDLPEAEEHAHGGHPDFRLGGKIFATLGSPDGDWGMVRLTPDQQEILLAAEPAMFKPASGIWGQRGCTLVRLEAIDEATAKSALTMAWRDRAPKKLLAKYPD
jgi:hypothetical protein